MVGLERRCGTMLDRLTGLCADWFWWLPRSKSGEATEVLVMGQEQRQRTEAKQITLSECRFTEQ
jgi:hypothetical protein